MAVEQHAARQLAGDVGEQQRSTAGQAMHLDPHARKRLLTAPRGHQLHRLLHVSVALPLRIEQRGLVRNAHIGGKPIDDRPVPGPGDEAGQPLEIHTNILSF
jgi:hypothetical protein